MILLPFLTDRDVNASANNALPRAERNRAGFTTGLHTAAPPVGAGILLISDACGDRDGVAATVRIMLNGRAMPPEKASAIIIHH